MLTEKDSPSSWLQTYQVEDLSRSLVREYLQQNKLTSTLQCLQQQDRWMYKKINKSVLVKLLSMNNLVYFNKQSEKPYGSMLEILVGYLRDKFKTKIDLEGGSVNGRSDTYGMDNSLKEPSEPAIKADNSLNNTVKLQNTKDNNLINSKISQHTKNKRPMTSGNRPNSRNVQNIYAELEKQDAKEKQKKRLEEKQKEEKEKKEKQESERKRKIQEQKQQQKERKKEEQRLRLAQIEKEKELQRQSKIEKERQNQRRQIELQKQKQAKAAVQRKKKAQQEQKAKKQRDRLQKQQEEKQNQLQKQRKKKLQEQTKRLQQQEKKRQQQLIQAQKIKQQEQSKSKTDRLESENGSKPELALKQNPRMGGMRKLVKKKEPEPENQVEIKKQAPSEPVVKQQAPFILEQQKIAANVNENESKKDEPPKMVTIFGKKKKNQQQPEEPEVKKFKFDDNFVDQPLYSEGEKYAYEKLQLNRITIKNPTKAEINYRQKSSAPTKKPLQKSITQQQAQLLKKAVFQGTSPILPKSWHQGFILSPHAATPYGLQQIQGGPCGIIAAIQCYFLKHLLHLAQPTIQELSNETLRQNCLVAAITDMLYKSRNSDKITLTLPPKGFSGTKLDISTFRIVTIEAITFAQVYQSLYQYRSSFIGKNNHGVAVLMFCNVMTKGIEQVWSDMDMPDNPLIGHHGHCTQELVNLFITGRATSNIFDGVTKLDDLSLKGIVEKSQFGFLTIYQTNDQLHVGKNLKNPIYPFWIICKQFHYHAIFANHYLISQNNNTPKFDIVYFDGLYNCADRIVITLEAYGFGDEEAKEAVKVKDLPLIEQVMKTKWGLRKADWNGSIKIL